MKERTRRTFLGFIAGIMALFGAKAAQRPANGNGARNGLARADVGAKPTGGALVQKEWDLPSSVTTGSTSGSSSSRRRRTTTRVSGSNGSATTGP